MNRPLPDPFGYDYEDISAISNVKKAFPESKDTPSEASRILKESKVTITEGLKDTLLKVIGAGFVNIIRGKLLNAFDINIDSAKFTKYDNKNLDKDLGKFKDPRNIYVSVVSKNGKTCAVVINKGKIQAVIGEKNLVTKSDGYRSILSKAESTWLAKNPDLKEEFRLSKAQKLLLD